MPQFVLYAEHKNTDMKKILLSLFAVVASVAGAFAMNLREAYTSLSELPQINVRAADYNLPVIADVVQDGEIAAAYNLDGEQIHKAGNAAFAILNEVPLSFVVNGGTNGEVAAFVYASPLRADTSEILVVAMSGLRGSVVAMYGTVDNAVVDAIRQAPLKIEGSFLSLEAHLPGDKGDFNIILSKAR